MASDPHVSSDRPAPSGDARALKSMWLGVAACILGAVSPCLCYVPWVVAFPLGCVGLYRSLRADRSTLSLTAKDVVAAAMILNGVAVAFGAVFLLFLLFFLLYFCCTMLFMGR